MDLFTTPLNYGKLNDLAAENIRMSHPGWVESYNKHYLPAHPVYVRVDMWVQEVTAVSELTQDFEIDLYINEFWEDPALIFDFMDPCKTNISFDEKVLQKLWIPNTCFINSKNAAIHESPFRNIFLMVFANGTLWTNYRMKLTGPCDMNLKRFPFDQQKCILTFESFNYNTGEVRMSWNQPYPCNCSRAGIIILLHHET
ncbi:Neurotransmitter-gated ion-channel ligand binding domain protein [Onchocerca flexuosa]|uniref:Neurotransmitter-gated ion-channel ligand binding domain protein n=1 Tax=Onchocerca flexuosa TaxID=387005 RepID=A0A238BZU8_9BILA|nr:Neurotransmitter-gated ion-channel ligand binding domain protein [Onchocerca flexuosa]